MFPEHAEHLEHLEHRIGVPHFSISHHRKLVATRCGKLAAPEAIEKIRSPAGGEFRSVPSLQRGAAGVIHILGDRPVLDLFDRLIDDKERHQKPFARHNWPTEAIHDLDL